MEPGTAMVLGDESLISFVVLAAVSGTDRFPFSSHKQDLAVVAVGLRWVARRGKNVVHVTGVAWLLWTSPERVLADAKTQSENSFAS